MYLKALEIQGFKSFPDKTVLSFGEDITAIVGPNGSGKSNISDSIRWVMGEQSSKALRGGKMEDVIFGGTLKRKQTGYAEVSLILDNSEHTLSSMEESEVMVTRRYYRSGESEYYINRQSCRLRDINDLFMDTGLGREGYSIIGQGKIDEILSTRGQERRAVFEEAAGISRFRHRKEEAERKLDKTTDNLLRIGDKISELELQVEPLREQAAKAKEFLLYRDELRGLEISVWMENLDRLRQDNRKLFSDFEEAARQRDEASKAQQKFYTRTEELAARMRQLDIDADQLRMGLSALTADAGERESAIAILQNQVQNNKDNAERLSRELDQQEDRAERSDLLIGRNPVTEALKSGRSMEKVILQKGGGGSLGMIARMAKDRGIVVEETEKAALDRLAAGGAHQGAAAVVSAHSYAELEDVLKAAADRGEDPLLVVLDGIEDPHNLGAIMRTAECAGAHGVIIPKRRAAGLTETVAKSSAGAIEYMPVVRVTNIAMTLEKLKEQGIWVYACDMDGALYTEQSLTGPAAIVVGAEGAGVSRLVREKCDGIVSIPMRGKINSLNASNAAAILLYEIRRQRDAR